MLTATLDVRGRRMNAVVEGPHLTPREADIVDLVCAHLIHGAIAGQLGISRRTGEWHIDKILRKLPLDIGYSPRGAALDGRCDRHSHA